MIKTLGVLLLSLAAAPMFGSPIFISLSPGSTVFGAPGDTLQFQITIQRDPGDFLFIDSVTPEESILPIGTFGQWVDLLQASGPTNGQFDPGPGSFTAVLGTYTIDPFASIGGSDVVQFDIAYDLFPCPDPGGSPGCGSDESGLVTDLASNPPVVTIQATPEPATFYTTGAIAAFLLAIARKRRRTV